ncbi:MAG: helix-turn-helix domain-containing protein [Oscillospiraceae bacterium]|nr:helix-turn-helix domain-containing protein [Oscillospiraceae bacterium]
MENKIENIIPQGFTGIWIDREILLQDNLSLNEKIIISIIKSFEENQSECFASNKFFSKVLNLSSKRASEIINGLVTKGFITSETIFRKNTKAIEKRILRINNAITYPDMSGYPPPRNTDTPPEFSGYPPPRNTEDIINIYNKPYNKNYIKNNKCSNFENLSDDVSDEFIAEKAIEFYFDTYFEYHSTLHPNLKTEQLNRVREELSFRINEFYLSLEDVQEMTLYFFEHPPKGSDGNINLFVERSVFVRVGYSTGVISGYTEL